MVRREEILGEALERCLTEMYKRSQPSIAWKKIKELFESGYYNDENRFFDQHYLSVEEYDEIVKSFISAYCMQNLFKEHCDLVYDYLENGGYKDVFEKETEDGPTLRKVERTEKLSEVVGEENAKKCLELISLCRNFFRGEIDETTFRVNVMNFAPSTDKEAVQKYWDEQGKKVVIKDRCLDEYGEWVYVKKTKKTKKQEE